MTSIEMGAQSGEASDLKSSSISPPAAPKSRLAALPEELLSNISVRLGSDDIFSLRLTCRDIEAKTFHEFASEYFAAKCFILTTESLKCLVHIASHAKLREYLTIVYLAPAELPRAKSPRCEHGTPLHLPVRKREALAGYVADQKQLQASGDDKRLLVEAFNKLPAVSSVGVIDTLEGLPEGVECRGMVKIMRTTGSRPPLSAAVSFDHVLDRPLPHGSTAWLTHVWSTLLHALAECGTSTVTRLVTDLAPGLCPLTDLKFKKSMMPQIARALGNVKELSINLRCHLLRRNQSDGDDDSDGEDDSDGDDDSDGEDDSHRARLAMEAFALALPRVTSIKLTFDVIGDSVLHSGNLFRAFMNKLELGNITKLEVDQLVIDSKSLAVAVCKLKSVQTLALRSVNLDGGSWVSILKCIARLPCLDHLHLMYLTESRERVYFLEQLPFDGSTNFFGHAHAGSDEDQWVEDEDGDFDEELPPLIAEGSIPDEPNEPVAVTAVKADVAPKPPCKARGTQDYKAPGMEDHPERGYFVCIKGKDEIQKEIPRFIEGYNLGDDVNADDISNVLWNTIFNGAGILPVPPLPPMPAAANAHAQGAPQNPNAGGNPVANLQAMFGPPTQVGGNAQNGYATYSFHGPIPGGNPFAGGALAYHPPPPPPPHALHHPPPTQPQQAPTPAATEPATTSAASASTGQLPSSWASTTEGASEDSLMNDEFD